MATCNTFTCSDMWKVYKSRAYLQLTALCTAGVDVHEKGTKITTCWLDNRDNMACIAVAAVYSDLSQPCVSGMMKPGIYLKGFCCCAEDPRLAHLDALDRPPQLLGTSYSPPLPMYLGAASLPRGASKLLHSDPGSDEGN